MEEKVQKNQMGEAASLAVTLDDRRETAKINNAGKYERKSYYQDDAVDDTGRPVHGSGSSLIFQNNNTNDNVATAAPDAKIEMAAMKLNNGRLIYRFLKRFFDVLFSICVLVLLSWLFVLVAIAIKIDDPSGPVLFGQERVGKNGKLFHMWKFRSMVTDAEERINELQSKNEKSGPVFKIKYDPRVTRVGHFIRKTSIDELPQFINVLRGEMSVVGPRPALPKEVAQYTQRQNQRLLVKPGMTCYWQTRRNRDAISFDEWINLDLLYIRKCSIWCDFKLIIQTVGVVLTAQGS